MAPKDCVFCQIAAGSRPAHGVFESRLGLGFLDARPLFRGHCLVTPRRHWETLLDLPEEERDALFRDVQLVARAVKQALGCDGVFVACNNRVSQSVPHLHVHVVPRRFKDGLRGFFWPRQRYRDEREAGETAAAIRAALAEG